MVKLSTTDVSHIAKLANLKLTKAQTEKYKEQLSAVLTYFDELNEVDTKNTEPTSQTTGLTNVTREDVLNPNQTLSVEEALSGTDKIKNNYFSVPAILNKE